MTRKETGRHNKGKAKDRPRLELPTAPRFNRETRELLVKWQRMGNAEREAYGWQFERFRAEAEGV